MLTGIPPFYDSNFQKMYKKILSSPVRYGSLIVIVASPQSPVRAFQLKFPAYLTPEAKDVLAKLLARPVDRRLGSAGGFNDIASTTFFATLDMTKARAGRASTRKVCCVTLCVLAGRGDGVCARI